MFTHLMNFRRWFSRSSEPEFTHAFVAHLEKRFGFDHISRRLPRVRCAWRLEDQPHSRGVLDFAIFTLEGDHVTETCRLVEQLLRPMHHNDDGYLFRDAAADAWCSVALRKGETVVTVSRLPKERC